PATASDSVRSSTPLSRHDPPAGAPVARENDADASTVSPTPGAPAGRGALVIRLEPSLLSAGGRHSCAVGPESIATCWGANDQGQLGDGAVAPRSIPAPVFGALRVTQVANGLTH